MAEPIITTLANGLDLDSSKVAVKEGSWTYALNACLSSRSGNFGFIQNEESNSLCFTFKAGYYVIGYVNLDDSDETVLFLVNPTTNSSEIGVKNKYCQYTTLVNNDCLNFSIEHQIQAEYRPYTNCGRRIYWTDDYNPMRWIDIDKIDNPFDCAKIKVFRDVKFPCITVENGTHNGGGLFVGSYQATLQYADVDGNPLTETYGLTNPYSITKDDSNGGWTNFSGEVAGVATTKAIQFNFANLDTSFQYFNLIVVKSISGIKTAQIVAKLTTTTLSYLYTGNESSIDITLDDVIKEPIIYTKAKNVVQVNDRLLWSNLEGENDFNYQPYANNIQVRWVTYRTKSTSGAGSYRNPWMGVNYKGYMRDEVYALGIRLVYKNGTKSCVYHIPGRKKNLKANNTTFTGTTDQYGNVINPASWDSQPPVINNDVLSTSETQRWQVYNTGQLIGSHPDYVNYLANGGNAATYTGLYQYGEMAYWESQLLYPNVPVVWNGLENTPIRHNKFPDCSITHIHDSTTNQTDDTWIFPIGFEIDNVQIPTSIQNIIEGWEIVYSDRTFDKSIVAKGLIFNLKYNTLNGPNTGSAVDPPYYYTNWTYNDLSNFSDPVSGHDDVTQYDKFSFYSPNTLLKKTNIANISEIKVESEEYATSIVNSHIDYNTGPYVNINDGGYIFNNFDTRNSYAYYKAFILGKSTSIRRNISDKEYILPSTVQTSTFGITNNIYREGYVHIGTTNTISANTMADNSQLYTRSTYDVSSYYASLKRSNLTQYGDLQDLKYCSTGYCTQTGNNIDGLFGGDCFITLYTLHRRVVRNDFSGLGGVVGPYFYPPKVPNDELSGIVYQIGTPCFWTETDINSEMRASGVVPSEYFYPDLNNGNISFTTWTNPEQVWLDKDNVGLYLEDYSNLNNLKSICTFSDGFDFSKCQTSYPNRSIYSEQNNKESVVDYYLSYLANSYYDYPKQDGEIWQTFVSNNTLYTRTTSSMFLHQLNFQEMQTDVNNIIIGTGALFSIPPIKISEVDEGYLGTKSQWCLNQTPFGTFMCDQDSGKIWSFESKPTEISATQTYYYFNNELKSKLKDQVDGILGIGTFKNFDNPANPDGTGITSVWDGIHKRFILTKRDYLLKDPSMLKKGDIKFDGSCFYTNPPSPNKPQKISLDDVNYFCNKGFTISYSPLIQKWVSFHSYLPLLYLNSKEEFFSSNGPRLWKHNTICSYNTYYNKIKPFIIEITQNNKGLQTYISPSLMWTQEINKCISDEGKYTSDELIKKNITFNKAYVYNDDQHSGMLTLNLKDNNNLSLINSFPNTGLNETNIEYSDREKFYSFSEFNNIVKYQDLWKNINTNDCNNSDYIFSYPIDKVPNNSNLDYNMNWWDRDRFRGKWISYRLILDNENNYNIVTNFFIDLNNRASNR